MKKPVRLVNRRVQCECTVCYTLILWLSCVLLSLLLLVTLLLFPVGIIAKEPVSLEQEIQELRSSGSSSVGSSGSGPGAGGGPASSAEFELADIFSFCRRGVESIVDDEVTKRFSAEELESWNLLTRSNYNFQHISTRLTVLWGLGVIIRYGFLLPLRCVC